MCTELLAWHDMNVCLQVHESKVDFATADIGDSRMWHYCLLDE